MNPKNSNLQVIKIPIRLVEEIFGKENYDDAGDAVLALLDGSDYLSRFSIAWSFECEHANPWYHTMNLNVDGLSDFKFEDLKTKITLLGIYP